MELLKFFDIILQSDIRIINECKSLKNVWVQLLSYDDNTNFAVHDAKRELFRNDECMMTAINHLDYAMRECGPHDIIFFSQVRNRITSCHIHTPLLSFVFGILLTCANVSLGWSPLQVAQNKTSYRRRRILQSNIFGMDISTCRLWYSILMTQSRDYRLSLRIVNNVLSRISPFTLYYSGEILLSNEETKRCYVDKFSINDTHVRERARRAWVYDLLIMPYNTDIVLAAIQVELRHCDRRIGVHLSPFICAYYLMFLNYYGLRQYDKRDRALRLLIEAANNPEQDGIARYHSYNIAGHCLLSVGDNVQARDMFMRSYQSTLQLPAIHKLNSAHYYLQIMSNYTTVSWKLVRLTYLHGTCLSAYYVSINISV